MAWRFGRQNRLEMKREVWLLMRTWPPANVTVARLTPKYNEDGERTADAKVTVYSGPALIRPAGGTSATFGLGTVENYDLVIVINGKRDIRQSDVVTVNDGREYEVMFPPGWFNAFMVITLKQRSQIVQPVQ